MKLQFDANLTYQQQAIASAVDLFRGQPRKQCNFTVPDLYGQMNLAGGTGVGNCLRLSEEEILKNLQEVQLRNGLAQSKSLKGGKLDFDVEMETGTGKTYVYLRTIFELNKAYGFTKFIIVVPGIAIKEGVYKTLQITQEHFKTLYDNVVYDYFVYDSGKLEQVRNFAVNDSISIMVINIGAFRKSFSDTDENGNLITGLARKELEKKSNIIHRADDKLNGSKPIELIQETNPFVIIDEPQSVDTTPKSKEAIASLHPLCIFRYSATHVEKHNLIYKLDAVDSFDMGLVKQIEVASFASEDNHNMAYFKLKSVDNKKSPITARIEMDVLVKGVATRKTVTVRQNDDLYELSKGHDVYENYIVDEIYCEPGNEYVSFTAKPTVLRLGQAVGDVDDLTIKEQQIRRTIQEHLDKELILNPLGIKVLSLFFIDRVANYRYYDKDGNPQKGIYAKLFEKNYKELIQFPKYRTLAGDLRDLDVDVSKVHNGYFSQDKKGKKKIWKDTSGTTAADEDVYNLIMKDKEKLLSFDSKLRFIFSHSALREGWDNPNVFQICTLNETHSKVKKRQEIGRGLRLCVNQNGERQYGNSINTLTVMANESYIEFAAGLQHEYEEDEGIRFGILEAHSFANILVKQADGTADYLGEEKSGEIYHLFAEKGYIDESGRVQDKLRKALRDDLLEVPTDVIASKPAITDVCKKVCGSLKIRPANDKRVVTPNKEVLLSPDFKDLWDRIKYKTTYSVDFDSNKLIEKCCDEMQQTLGTIQPAKLIFTEASLNPTKGGVMTEERERRGMHVQTIRQPLPDIVTYLQNVTNLTRRTIVDILVRSKTLNIFYKNPQRYMEEVSAIMKRQMRSLLVDGIKYTRLGDDEYYAQELFETEELTGYLERNMLASKKSAYHYVVYDSENEKTFAERFEANNAVKLYAKLPHWFKIPTPLGSYNPDWAILIEQDGEKKLYFVLETKGSTLKEDLRQTEWGKIECGRRHFAALGKQVTFDTADKFDKFIERV